MQQYSIVCYLDKGASKQVRQLQEKLSYITGSYQSLTSWEPHITVGDGILIRDGDLDKAVDKISNCIKDTAAFNVQSKGYLYKDNRVGGEDEITTPYVLSLRIELNTDLINLQNKIQLATSTFQKWYKMPSTYSPHVTLAFRDLDKKGYRAGKSFLDTHKFEVQSDINAVSLVLKTDSGDKEARKILFQN